jgi:hypothetical protein
MPSGPLRVRCRQIRDSDRDGILDLFMKGGFGGTRDIWERGLRSLSVHPAPPGFPKYGYLLEVNNVPVGMLLLISSTVMVNGQPKVRCNVSSWYVWPAFRGYGPLLVAQAMRHKEATYFNISPLPHTLDMLTAQGYTRYCEGRFTAVPLLNFGSPKVRIAPVSWDTRPGADLQAHEIDLLRRHAKYGCLSLVVTLVDRRYPFVFEPIRNYRVVRIAYLVYCRNIDDFVRVAGPLGRYLLRRGFLFVSLDANGPVPGLIGRYAETAPKYFKGPDRPRLGDLAYSERSVLGLRFPPRLKS